MPTDLLTENLTSTWSSAQLSFVRPDGYLDAVEHFYRGGARRFLMRPHDPSLATRLQARFDNIHFLRETADSLSFDAVLVPPM